MKATFKREPLLAAFQIVSTAVPAKSSKPILCNIRLEIGENQALLYGTDTEVGIQATIKDVDSCEPGTVLLDCDKLGSILKSVPDETISFSSTEKGILIRGGKSKFNMPTANPLEFPSFPVIASDKYHAVPSTAFKTMLQRVQFCCDGGGRQATDGVLLECNDGELIVVGASSSHGAMMSVKAESANHLVPKSVIPRKSLPMAIKASQGETTYITCTDNNVFLRSEGCVAFIRLMEGEFPNWRKGVNYQMPKGTVSLELKTDELSLAVNQACIIGTDDNGLLFTLQDNKLLIEGTGNGEASAEVSVTYEGPMASVCLKKTNTQHLLRSVSGNPNVTFQLFGREYPAKMNTADGFNYVASPMRTK